MIKCKIKLFRVPLEGSFVLVCSVLFVAAVVEAVAGDAELVGDEDGSAPDFDGNSFALGRLYFGSSHESRIGIRPLPIRRLSFVFR